MHGGKELKIREWLIKKEGIIVISVCVKEIETV